MSQNDDLPRPTLPSYPVITRRLFEVESDIRIYKPGGGAGGSSGAFFNLITIEDGPDAGDIHLQGGTVNGLPVATLDLKLYDLSLDSWGGPEGEHLFLEVVGSGVISDGVLLPGFTISTITPSYGAPSEHVPPTHLDASCTAYLSLGIFGAAAFYPSAPGNREIALCIGSFSISP